MWKLLGAFFGQHGATSCHFLLAMADRPPIQRDRLQGGVADDLCSHIDRWQLAGIGDPMDTSGTSGTLRFWQRKCLAIGDFSLLLPAFNYLVQFVAIAFFLFFLTLARPHKHAAIHNIWIYIFIVLYSDRHTLSPVLSPPQNAFCTRMQEEISKSCCLWKRKSFTNQSTCHMWKIMRIVQILASNVKNHCWKIRLKKEKQITNNKQKQTHYTQLVVNEDCFWNCSNFFN